MGKQHPLEQDKGCCPSHEIAFTDEDLINVAISKALYVLGLDTATSPDVLGLSRKVINHATAREVLNSERATDLRTFLAELLTLACFASLCIPISMTENHFVEVPTLVALVETHLNVFSVSNTAALEVLESVYQAPPPLFDSKTKLLSAVARFSIPKARRPIDGIIAEFFSADITGWTNEEVSFQVMNLHLVSIILNHEHDEQETFMDELMAVLFLNSANKTVELNPAEISWSICRSAIESEETFSEEPETNFILQIEETREFAALIMLAPAYSRETIINAMSAALLGRPHSCELLHLTLDVGLIKSKIEETWERMRHGFMEEGGQADAGLGLLAGSVDDEMLFVG